METSFIAICYDRNTFYIYIGWFLDVFIILCFSVLCCVFVLCLSSSCVVCTVWSVSLYCPFLIVPSGFSNVYFAIHGYRPGVHKMFLSTILSRILFPSGLLFNKLLLQMYDEKTLYILFTLELGTSNNVTVPILAGICCLLAVIVIGIFIESAWFVVHHYPHKTQRNKFIYLLGLYPVSMLQSVHLCQETY